MSFLNKKIINKGNFNKFYAAIKKSQKIGLCHGAFDILHFGHIEFLKNQYTQFNPDKSIPFIFDNLGFKKGIQTFDESQQMKLCVGLLTEGYLVYVYTPNDMLKQLSQLSESYDNRLKFLKQGINPQGYKINLQ